MPLDPEEGSPGRGPCGVTGLSPGTTGNGIMKPPESFDGVSIGSLREDDGVAISAFNGVGSVVGKVSFRGVIRCASLDTVGGFARGGRSAKGTGTYFDPFSFEVIVIHVSSLSRSSCLRLLAAPVHLATALIPPTRLPATSSCDHSTSIPMPYAGTRFVGLDLSNRVT